MQNTQPTPTRVVDRRSSAAPVPDKSVVENLSDAWRNLPHSEKIKIHEDSLEAKQKKKDIRLLRGIVIGCGLLAAAFFTLVSIFSK